MISGASVAEDGSAVQQDTGQVSSDWWRVGHVTTVLTSDWPAVPARQAPRLHGQLPRHGGHAGEYCDVIGQSD